MKQQNVLWPVVGSIWKERDRRFSRRVRVLAVDKETGKVTIESEGVRGRATRAKVERFNGKHGGYELCE